MARLSADRLIARKQVLETELDEINRQLNEGPANLWGRVTCESGGCNPGPIVLTNGHDTDDVVAEVLPHGLARESGILVSPRYIPVSETDVATSKTILRFYRRRP